MSKQSGKDTSFAGPDNAAIRSSDAKTNSRSAASLIRSAARKAKRAKRARRLMGTPLKQGFCKTWLEEPLFKMWLQETEDPYTVKCTVCSKLLRGTKFTLRKHARTNLHNMNMRRKDNGVAAIAVSSDAVIRSPDAETDSNSAASFIRSPAKKARSAKRNRKPSKQAFCKAWLEEPQFALWVQETEDPYTVKCTFCSKFLTAGKGRLKQHARTTVHITNKQRKAGALISVSSISATTTDTGVVSVAGPSLAAIKNTDSSVAGLSDAVIRSSDAETDSRSAVSLIRPTAKELKQAKTQPSCKIWLKGPQFFNFITILKPGHSFRLEQ